MFSSRSFTHLIRTNSLLLNSSSVYSTVITSSASSVCWTRQHGHGHGHGGLHPGQKAAGFATLVPVHITATSDGMRLIARDDIGHIMATDVRK